MIKKIVCTGGRNYKNWNKVKLILDVIKPDIVFVGDATGADSLVRDWCIINKVDFKVFVADWKKFGKSAGPIRNKEMLLASGIDATVIAFPGGKGTENCIDYALYLGLNVKIIMEEVWKLPN